MLKRAVAGVGAEDREEEQRGVTSDSVNNCKENENDTEASFVITDLNNPKSQGYVSSTELTWLEQGLRYRGRKAERWLLCSNLHTDPTHRAHRAIRRYKIMNNLPQKIHCETLILELLKYEFLCLFHPDGLEIGLSFRQIRVRMRQN